MPRGDTSLRAMVLAIWAADPENVPAGGCVESVVTPRTHRRFRVRAVVEADGIDLVQPRCGPVVASQRSCRLTLKQALRRASDMESLKSRSSPDANITTCRPWCQSERLPDASPRLHAHPRRASPDAWRPQ
jgi:hypothetical protein